MTTIAENRDKSQKYFGEKKVGSIWERIESGTKKKGTDRCFHHFILRFWKEIEDIRREAEMEGVAFSVLCYTHWVESEGFFFLKKISSEWF